MFGRFSTAAVFGFGVATFFSDGLSHAGKAIRKSSKSLPYVFAILVLLSSFLVATAVLLNIRGIFGLIVIH